MPSAPILAWVAQLVHWGWLFARFVMHFIQPIGHGKQFAPPTKKKPFWQTLQFLNVEHDWQFTGHSA